MNKSLLQKIYKTIIYKTMNRKLLRRATIFVLVLVMAIPHTTFAMSLNQSSSLHNLNTISPYDTDGLSDLSSQYSVSDFDASEFREYLEAQAELGSYELE